MMILTCVAILAVDFKVFPRRFAKTETDGTSVMDMGVGAFIFSAALVSRQTRRVRDASSSGSQLGAKVGASVPAPPSLAAYLGKVLSSTLLAVSPLLALGLVRLAVHEAVNYQRHESEYGVHWNFFFTTAAVAVLAAALEAAWHTAVHCCGGAQSRWLLMSRKATALCYFLSGLAVAVAYQLLLAVHLPEDASGGGGGGTVEQYILQAARVEGSFVAQNREGLAGVVGFFALYLCGVGAGRALLDPARATSARWRALLAWGAGLCALLWLLTAAAVLEWSVSRRLVNLPYVLWVLAYTLTMLLAVLAMDVCTVVYTCRPGWPQPLQDLHSQQQQQRHVHSPPPAHGGTAASEAPPPQPSSQSLLPLLGKDAEAVSAGSASASARSRRRLRSGSPAGRLPASSSSSGLFGSGSIAAGGVGPLLDQPGCSNSGAAAMVCSPPSASAGAPSSQSFGGSLSPPQLVWSGSGAPPLSRSSGGGGGQRVLLPPLWERMRRMFVRYTPLPPAMLAGGSVVMESMSVNFLAIFIVANLLVGVPNHTLETDVVPDAGAMAILSLYMVAVCAVAVAWRLAGLQLKFW